MDFTECYQDTCSTVALAARRGDSRRVSKLIKKGYSVDVKDNRGWTALHEAAASGSSECVRFLLGAAVTCEDYVNSLTHNSETPLYFAAKNGHLRAVNRLIKGGGDIKKMSNDLSSPLFAAVDGGHKEVVQLLVSKGAEVNGAHSTSGWSCLHQAVYKGHTEIVKFLVSICSLEAVDDYGITPLFVAAQYGRHHCLEVLVNAGANVNCQANDLATPLLIAAQEGHLSCVELLLARKADPNLYCNEDQWQLPIHAAAQFARVSILEKLISVTGRDCDQGEGKVSPIYLSVLGGQADSLRPLLREGYSPDAQNCRQFGYYCPLDMALWCNSWNLDGECHQSREIAQVLLAAGAHVSLATYVLALQGHVPEHLPLILEHAGLPAGEELWALVQAALDELPSAPFWLPLLLKAGLDPSLLLKHKMLEEAESRVLNFLLEFINWKSLPSTMLHILSRRRAEGTWTPHGHFESVPALTHLCRLAVRAAVGSDALSKPSFVQQLPIPTLLQDYLQFNDISSAYTYTAA
ncbi:ankyrin repeat and SOCS box protein 3 isoform X1 [Electrophorus electricus]|uniref:SOCS box domain-containing protein n=1 Tax=Electrophorus electricus TaxID=8005 RepID=A0A4W4GE14_ELEEL|nr:ankyrin repeat and SOCS box protein 3 isoform X1 [Electrophorus electricus]XP_026858413.2 ankyrin repeat and SOCS box protein 3 isoform X1 [Electrophorus electricus]